MTTTKRRLTVADLAPGYRFRSKTRAQPERGRRHIYIGWDDHAELIIAHHPGHASWHFVQVEDVVTSSITPPRKADQ